MGIVAHRIPKGLKSALLGASPGFKLGHQDCTDELLRTTAYRWPFTMKFLLPCTVDLDMIPFSAEQEVATFLAQ